MLYTRWLVLMQFGPNWVDGGSNVPAPAISFGRIENYQTFPLNSRLQRLI